MNKKSIEKLIPRAKEQIEKQLAQNGIVDSTYRGYIASFGAAVLQSGLMPAVAFYSSNKSAKGDRNRLMSMIKELIDVDNKNEESLFDYIQKRVRRGTSIRHMQEEVINAAISIKLAMGLFEMKQGDGGKLDE